MHVWKGFHAGKTDEPCDGTIEVEFHGSRVTQRQLDAVVATQKRAARMQMTVLEAILRAYPKLEKLHPVLQRSHGLPKKPEKMTKAALKRNFALWQILVTTDHHEDVAYVCYELRNSWHPSGTTVLTHGDRVVAVGDSELLGYPHVDPARKAPMTKRPTAAAVKSLREAAKKRAAKNPKDLRGGNDEIAIYLPAWAGFVAGEGSPSEGDVMVDVGGDARDDTPLGPPQQAAYQHLVRHAATVQASILDALAKAYPKIASKVGFDGPQNVDRAALESLVELTAVHVHGAARGGIAIVGYELAAAWDREHGAGVLVHRDRVLALGGADTAILQWMAEKAAKKVAANPRRPPAGRAALHSGA